MSLLMLLHLRLAHGPPKLDHNTSEPTANQIHTLQTAFTNAFEREVITKSL